MFPSLWKVPNRDSATMSAQRAGGAVRAVLGAVEEDAGQATCRRPGREGERLLARDGDRRVDRRDLGVDADRVEHRRRGRAATCGRDRRRRPATSLARSTAGVAAGDLHHHEHHHDHQTSAAVPQVSSVAGERRPGRVGDGRARAPAVVGRALGGLPAPRSLRRGPRRLPLARAGCPGAGRSAGRRGRVGGDRPDICLLRSLSAWVRPDPVVLAIVDGRCPRSSGDAARPGGRGRRAAPIQRRRVPNGDDAAVTGPLSRPGPRNSARAPRITSAGEHRPRAPPRRHGDGRPGRRRRRSRC